MRVNTSLKLYPRLDQEYKKKSSLDFQRLKGNVFKNRPNGNFVQLYLWMAFFFIGALMGVIAFLLDLLVENLSHLRWFVTQKSMEYSPILAYISLITFSIFYVFIAASITVYIAPAAMGSGVAEAMGALNGVAYPDFISIKTLIVKFFGLSFAVAGGLCGGKEGPLVHIGSIVGAAVAYMPLKIFNYFRNDTEKRKLMSAGIAAGVSAAFGAPIGGSLFAYEISKPNTFWSFSLTWKVFFASSIATFVLSILKQLYEWEFPIKLINSGNVKLAAIQDEIYMDAIVAAGIIGIIGGAIGSIFIRVNNLLNLYRKKVLNTKFKKILEALLLVIMTTTAFYLSSFFSNCMSKNDEKDPLVKNHIEVKVFNCPEGTYNRIATLLFDGQSTVLRVFMTPNNAFLMKNVYIFIGNWILFTYLTSGTAVPCGIFLPCMLIGCALG